MRQSFLMIMKNSLSPQLLAEKNASLLLFRVDYKRNFFHFYVIISLHSLAVKGNLCNIVHCGGLSMTVKRCAVCTARNDDSKEREQLDKLGVASTK